MSWMPSVLLPRMCYGTRGPRVLRRVFGKNSQTCSKEDKGIAFFNKGCSVVPVVHDPVAFLFLSGPGAVDVAGFVS